MTCLHVCHTVYKTVTALVIISVSVSVSGDKNETNTKSHGHCLSNHYPCNNGRCINDDYVCNGYDNCGDNSDESNGCWHSDERYWWKSVVGIVIAACLVIAAASCYVRKRLQMRQENRFANQNSYPPVPGSTSPSTHSFPPGFPSTTTNTQTPEYTLWTTQSPILPPPYSKEDKDSIPSAPPPPYSTLELPSTADTAVTGHDDPGKNNREET